MDALSLTTRFAKPVYTFLTSLHENSVKEYHPLGSSCYLTGNPSQGYVISLNTDVQGQPHTTIMMSVTGNVTTEQHHLSDLLVGLIPQTKSNIQQIIDENPDQVDQ